MKKYFILILTLFFFYSCKITNTTTSQNEKIANTKETLRFIGEQIIPENTIYKDTKVGGLSSIDYANGKYYLISDAKRKPIRFYEMELTFDATNFTDYKINNLIIIQNEVKRVDPEALRFDKTSNHFLWASEGSLFKGISPAVFEISKTGEAIKTHATPAILQVSKTPKTKGPRKNGTFEGLSMSKNENYYWVGMELPLKQDGNEPQLHKDNYPVRISKINKNTGTLDFQFAYHLDKIPRDSKPAGKYTVNGLSEILELDEKRMLIIERAYASGHKDGGNTIKIYIADYSKASDISKIESLKGTNYIPATKKLLINLDTIRTHLTNGVIDNIEGVTFGPTLKNGNKTLLVVSDNNFNQFGKQLNQLIVFEVIGL